jgi:hypothetical protein
MPPTNAPLAVTVNQRDIDRINKRLDKWQGAPLAKRLEVAQRGALGILVAPLRGRAGAHVLSGKTQRGISVRKLRRRSGEATPGYKVGSNTRVRHFAVVGTTRGVEPDPYFDEIERQYDGQISAFIDATVRRLA